jgi:endonuclease I
MNSDVHHIFASDGYVNSQRGSYPYGEVGSATFTSQNGSRVGAARANLGYSGTVFEPIDEFKGDVARAYFYMATRYENVISGWENNSSSSDAVLNGSSNQVFEIWALNMLKRWHQLDPVSQKELDRNNAAHSYQENRNPFVDYPEFVNAIWGN